MINPSDLRIGDKLLIKESWNTCRINIDDEVIITRIENEYIWVKHEHPRESDTRCSFDSINQYFKEPTEQITIEEGEPKELKPGDKVRVIATVTFRIGDILTVLKKVEGQNYYYYKRDSDGKNEWTNTCNVRKIINKEQTNNNQSIMTNVMNKIKELLRAEPEATFVKAGFMDENENLTEGGKEALQYVIWEANKDALKALADKIVTSEEKTKK